VTRLSQFEFRSRLKTWVYRLAVNYILDVKKSAIEQMDLGFDRFADNSWKRSRSIDEAAVPSNCESSSARAPESPAATIPETRAREELSGQLQRGEPP
jgi:DNA-directed RNA polymerase specialized sigma24 family protein